MKLLNQALRDAESAELFELKGRSVPVKFGSGELESVKNVETRGKALRVIKEGRLGFSTSTGRNNSQLIEKALKTSEFGDEADFDFPGPTETENVDTFDEKVANLTAEELIVYGKEVIQQLKEFDPDLEVDLNLSSSTTNTKIANSNHLELEEERTNISVGLEAKKVQTEDIFTFHESQVAQKLEELKLENLVQKVKQKLRWAQRRVEIESGKYPVIFTPRGLLVLIIPILAAFNGKNVFQGASPLSDSLGDQVFSESINISDFGSSTNSPTRRSFDDEGVPVGKTELVRDGVANAFLYNLQTAGLAGTESTGNGLKGGLISESDFRAVPEVSPTSLLIEAGGVQLGEMISQMNRGLVVDQVLGLGQGNPLSGQFSNNISVAYKVEDGEIKGRVKDTMISGNIYEILENGIRLSKETEWVGGSLKAPHLAVENVSVVHKG